MAEPKTQIERRLDALEIIVDRLVKAMEAMMYHLTRKEAGFNASDVEAVNKILRGEDEGVENATQ